jgi:hypothetical protein
MRSLLATLLIIVSGPALATTYRWVDAQGKVHYGDVMPNQSSGLGHQELDKQGRVIRESPRTLLTPEERRQRAAEAAAREEHLRRVEEQQRRDRALLSTYSNEGEIDLARDRALELENLTLKGLQTRLDNSAAKLAYANDQISRYRAAHVAVPANIGQMREEAQTELLQFRESMRQREKTIRDLKLRFEADRSRFLELMELKAMVRQ